MSNSSVKEMKHCMFCGEKNTVVAEFCEKCGKRIIKIDKSPDNIIEEKKVIAKKRSLFTNIPAEIVKGHIKKGTSKKGLLTIDESGIRFGDLKNNIDYFLNPISIEQIKTFDFSLEDSSSKYIFESPKGILKFTHDQQGEISKLEFAVAGDIAQEIMQQYNRVKYLCLDSGQEFTLKKLIHASDKIHVETVDKPVDKPSNSWYLLPLLFGILGGIGGYMALSGRDNKEAKNLLIFGIVWTLVMIFVVAALGAYYATRPIP